MITAKINPDLDGVACAYAYGRLLKMQGKIATGACFGKPHVEGQYLLDRFDINDLELNPKTSFDSYILVDASSLKGMPELIRAEEVIEVIDHRHAPEVKEMFLNAKIEIDLIGAAATMIVEKYQQSGLRIDQNSGLLLYGAIFSNTLHFKVSITSDRDVRAAKWLEENIQIPDNLIDDMFIAKTQAIRNNLKEVIRTDFKVIETKDGQVGIAQLEVINLQPFLEENIELILKTLRSLQVEQKLDYVFLAAVDIKNGFNIFFTSDEASKNLLIEKLGLRFRGNFARKTGPLLRKQIIEFLV